MKLNEWNDEAIRAEIKRQRPILAAAKRRSQAALAAERILHHLEHERDRRNRAARKPLESDTQKQSQAG